MVAKYYGKTYSLQYLRSRSYITREGVSMLGISEAAENVECWFGLSFPEPAFDKEICLCAGAY
jgi:hypothetical protein